MAVTEQEIKKAESITGRSFKMKTCEVCGENYYCARETSRVCSNRCRQQGYLARRMSKNGTPEADDEDLSDLEQKLTDKIKESKSKHI